MQSVGIVEFATWRLVSKRPEVLTAKELDPFFNFIRKSLEGIQPSKLERLLIAVEPQFLLGFAGKIGILINHGIPQDKIVYCLNKMNLKTFVLREASEIERIVVFLNHYGPGLILRRPMLMNLDLDSQIIPRIGFFQELGGDEESIRILLRKFPPMLSYSVEHMQEHKEFWKSVGLCNDEIFKIVLVYPGAFSVSKERKLEPRIEFLKQCGLNATETFKFLCKAPLFLSLSFADNLSKKLGFLVKLGYKHRTRELAFAMGASTRTSCDNMQLVIGVFLSYGFSCEDVFAMGKKHPQVLQYNHNSLKMKMEYLIEEMGREIGELLAFPAFLGYKLDERIKQRYELKKEIRGRGMSLNKLLSVSAQRFSNKKNSTEVEFELEEVHKV